MGTQWQRHRIMFLRQFNGMLHYCSVGALCLCEVGGIDRPLAEAVGRGWPA